MDRDITRDYLVKPDFSEVQAEALANLLYDLTQDLATKDDLKEVENTLRGEMQEMRLDFENRTHELRPEIESLRTDFAWFRNQVIWSYVALIPILVAALTLVQRFAG